MKIKLIILLLLISTTSLAGDLLTIVEDPNTQWYDHKTLPEVFESEGRLYRVGNNIGPEGEDPTGSPNNEFPWLHTGGLDHCGSEVAVRRALSVPKGKWIELYQATGNAAEKAPEGSEFPSNFPFSRISGTYPVGTTAIEFMYDKIRLFEVRQRTKTKNGWVTDVKEYGAKPKGYVQVNNCVDCHNDIGRHPEDIDIERAVEGIKDRQWYGTVRGLEKDGPIHWHPWVTHTESQRDRGIKPTIRRSVRHFVRWKNGS